jgi:tetratricopeptide (TPR) repeat protein
MDRVKQLYLSFSASERKAIRSYLDAFHLKGENKSIAFLKLIEKQPDMSHEQAAEKLYGDMRSKAFIMMKGRLLEKMTEFLALTVNPEAGHRDHDAPYHHDLIEFRKAMLYAASLQERQLSAMAVEHLEKARELAARCNAPELEVDVLIRLRGLDRASAGTDRFEELSIQIQKALVKQECDINATGLLRKFMALHSHQVTSEEARLSFLEAHLPDLEESLRQVYSPRADYFYQMLRVHYCIIKRDYVQGKVAASQAAEVLAKNDGIRSKMRKSDTWFQLGRLELSCGHFPEATASFEKARSCLDPDSRSVINIVLLLTYCHLFRRDLVATKNSLAEMKQGACGRAMQTNALARGLYSYLSSCLAYVQGDYQTAWNHLQDCQDTNLGKETWLTAIRLFEVMILIDKQDGDLASQKLENLRKHLGRYNTPPRMRLIYKLLAAQERISFQFTAVPGEEQELDRLRNELTWDPPAQEVVRFEDWYMAHRNKAGKK